MSTMTSDSGVDIRQEEFQECSLEGEIAYHGLADIFQFLEVGKKSGLLSVQNPEPLGVIVFERGAISFAQTHVAKGLDAILELLSQEDGSFRFYPDKKLVQRNCRFSTTQVLLHWAKRVDERNRHATGASAP